MQKREFFGALESLRGVAALMVVLFHIPAWNEAFFHLTPVRNGYLMVNLFFVLSGFVLFHCYQGAISSRLDLARFMILRFGRLYPVHIVFLALFLGVEVAKYVAAERFGLRSVNSTPFGENSIQALVEQVFLVQALGFSGNQLTFNAPAWSISTEFYTYVIFGVALLGLSRARFIAFSAALSAVAMALLVALGEGIGSFDGMVACVAGFFAGCLVSAAFQALAGRRLPNALCGLAFAATIAFLCVKERGNPAWDVLIFPLSALLVITLLMTPGSLPNVLLDSRPLRWLGERSYSLYMGHWLVIWVANQVLRVVFKAPDTLVAGKYHSRLTLEMAWVAYPATVLATIALAWLMYRMIENPARQWARRLADAAGRRASPEPKPAGMAGG